MLSKNNRITKRKEFGYIYKHGKYIYNEFLTIIYVPTKLNCPRIGFSLSKKVGKAHIRNYVKRQLSEIVRSVLPQLNQKMNYVFVPKQTIVELSFLEKQNNVLNLLTKAKLLNE